MYTRKFDFSRLRVLVVENHALMRRLLGEMLRGFGVQYITFARDVPDSIEHIYGETFDLVILDFFLGELDGADFAKFVRFDDNCMNREVPILLVTATPNHHKVLKVLDAGINAMLAKPIAAKDLYDRIHAILTNPRPFVISDTYVGPARSRPRRPARRPGTATITAKASAQAHRERLKPAIEDGFLF
ncbi:MAG: response regulator [Hyphomicrobiaceae bacterium]|nr:response regulator [Hyphomicrobiaceae bacterium]